MRLSPISSLAKERLTPLLFAIFLLIFRGSAHAQTSGTTLTRGDTRLVDARALLDKGLANDAERVARGYLQDHQNSAEGHFLLGYIFFREIQSDAERNTGDSPEEYQQSSQTRPNSNFQEATAKASLAEFTEGAKYRTPGAFDLKIVALNYVLLNDYADADKWLTRSLQMDAKDRQAWYYLGRTKYNENRFEEAMQAFEWCLKLDPRNVQEEENLGLAYAGLGRTEDALAAYKNAIRWQEKTQTKDAGPYINMGDLLLDQNRTEEAITYLKTAMEISPKSSKVHELLGKAYTRLDQLALAQIELEKAVSLTPQIASLHCMLGPVYRRQGLTEKAKTEFDYCSSLTEAQSSPRKAQP